MEYAFGKTEFPQPDGIIQHNLYQAEYSMESSNIFHRFVSNLKDDGKNLKHKSN